MKKIATSLLIAATLISTGCATQTGILSHTNKDAAYNKSQPFFIGGIGQEQTVDASQICQGAHNVAKVESSLQPKDIVFGLLTFGIYTPHTAKVYCK